MYKPQIRATVIEPDGRTVVLTEEAWEHIRSGHKELARYERTIMETVTHPIDRRLDERPNRERYVSEGGPARYFTVVVDFTNEPGEVVTAFGHRNER